MVHSRPGSGKLNASMILGGQFICKWYRDHSVLATFRFSLTSQPPLDPFLPSPLFWPRLVLYPRQTFNNAGCFGVATICRQDRSVSADTLRVKYRLPSTGRSVPFLPLTKNKLPPFADETARVCSNSYDFDAAVSLTSH